MSTNSSGLVSPDTPSGSPLLQRPLPPCLAPCHHPHIYHILCPSLHFPCMRTCHCSFNETTPYYCRGTTHEIMGDLPLPYISRSLLDVGIGHYESFKRSVLVTARAHDCEEILQPTFRPWGDANSLKLFR